MTPIWFGGSQGGQSEDWFTDMRGAGSAYIDGSDDSDTAQSALVYHPGYPHNGTFTEIRLTGAVDGTEGASSQYNRVPNSRFATTANRSDDPLYVALYIHTDQIHSSTDPAGHYGSVGVPGWYVFGPLVDQNPGVNGRNIWTQIVAWPTGGPNTDRSNNGFLGLGGDAYNLIVVGKNSRPKASGEGGTDSWSIPYELLEFDPDQ